MTLNLYPEAKVRQLPVPLQRCVDGNHPIHSAFRQQDLRLLDDVGAMVVADQVKEIFCLQKTLFKPGEHQRGVAF